MAKRTLTPRNAASADDIDRALSLKADFSFEMQVLSFMEAIRLDRLEHALRHSGTYTDPVTGKKRQFDIRYHAEVAGTRFHLAVECKNVSAATPWIVHTVPRRQEESFHEVLYFPDRRPGTNLLVRPEIRRVTRAQSAYPVSGQVGKSIDHLHYSSQGELLLGDSEVFDRLTQSVQSLRDLVLSGYDQGSVDSSWHVFVPVVVIPRGSLWLAPYDATGQRTAPTLQADRVAFFLDQAWPCSAVTSNYTVSHVELVTTQGLRGLVAELADLENGPWFRAA